MAGVTIFTSAYTFIDTRLNEFLNDRLTTVIHQVDGPLRLALVLYVVLYGISIVRGAISEPMIDFAIRSAKLAIIYALATTSAYSTNITGPLFHGLPNTLARAISGSEVPNVGASFDQFFSYGGALSEKIIKTASVADLGSYIVGGVVFVVTAFSTALGFGVVVVAKIALALLVALGPIFIACALFEATRRFFFGWLSQAVNYIVLFALIITIFQLVLELVRNQWPSIDGHPNSIVAGMIFSALCILGAIFFLQIPSIAAGIAGGASTGVADFFSAARFVSRRTRAVERPAIASPTQHTAPSGGSLKPSGVR